MTVAVVDQIVVIPYRQIDNFSTAPYVYAGFTTPEQENLNILSTLFKRRGSGTIEDPYVIEAKYTLYSLKGLSAFGLGNVGGGGGGGAIDVLIDWEDYSGEKELWALSAKLGKSLLDGKKDNFADNYYSKPGHKHSTEDITGLGDLSTILNWFEWDEVNQAIRAKYTLYSTGGLSAFGLGSVGSGGGGVDVLIDWASYDSTKETWALSAKLGVGLNTSLAGKQDTILPGTYAAYNHNHSIANIIDYVPYVHPDYGVSPHTDGTLGHITVDTLNSLKSILNWFEFDTVNNAIKAKYDFYSTGGLSAFGLGDVGSGGGAIFDRLDNWVDYDVDKATWVLSAKLGNDLYTNIQSLTSASHTHSNYSILNAINSNDITRWDNKENAANKNIAGGYAGLDSSGKIFFNQIPDIILGQLKWGGTINSSKIIASEYVDLNGVSAEGLSAITYKGYYFIAQANITVNSVPLNTGDWLVSNGAAGWTKVDNTDAISLVNGKSGNVVLYTDDIAETASPTNLWFTQARVRSSLLTGYSVGSDSAISATDSVLSSLGKIQGQINARALAVGSYSYPGFKVGSLDVNGTTLNKTELDKIKLVSTFFDWDGVNSAIKALYHLYSVGGLSAFGLGDTGSGDTTSQTNFASLSVNSQAVIHSGNIGSQSVSYATSAGNADTLDSYHASYFATSSHTHNSFYTKYVYPNNIAQSTTAATLSGSNENLTAMFQSPSIFGDSYGNAFVYTGYNQYGSTQLVTLYNASSGNNRMAFRVYNQGLVGYNNWTEIWTKDNLTNTLTPGYLPYWNNGSLVNSVISQSGTTISIDGSIYATGFIHSSDMRLKNVVRPLEDVLDKIRNLSTFLYTEKSRLDLGLQLGMSAQDFELYFPTIVAKDKFGYLGLQYPRVSVIAIKAIQELDLKQSQQERRILELENEVKLLKQKLHGTVNN